MTDRFLAFIGLTEDRPARAGDMLAALRAQPAAPGEKVDIVGSDDADSAPGGAWIVQLGEVLVTVMYVGAPLPPDALEEPMVKSGFFQSVPADLGRTIKAHYIVSHVTEIGRFENTRSVALAMTRVCAALCQTTPSIAAIWVEGATLTPPTTLVQVPQWMAQGQLPVPFWVVCVPFGGQVDDQGRKTFGIMTKGLKPFLGREIGFQPAPLDAGLVRERTLSLAAYLLANGPVLSDGDTVGISADEKIGVRFGTTGGAAATPIYELTLIRLDESGSPAGGPRPDTPPETPRQDGFGAAKQAAQRIFGRRG